jgi:type I restriction enzyme, S subunit
VTPEEIVASVETVSEAPGGIKRLREMILGLAIRGRLVPQSTEDAPAFLLLRDIATERASRISSGQLRRAQTAPEASDENSAFAVPESWQWARLGDLCFGVADGPHFSPKYVSADVGVPFLSARNIRQFGFELEDMKYVSREDHEKFCARTHPEVGDLLYTKGGTTGVAAVNDLGFEFSVWVHVAVLKVAKRQVVPQYLALALNGPHCYAQSQRLTHGTGNRDLGLTRMVLITIPLPPFAEQKRIVAKVDQLMALCADLEARQVKKRETAVRLNRAALDALTTAEGPQEIAASFRRIAENFEALVYAPESIAKLRDTILDLAVQGRLVPAEGGQESLNDAEVTEAVEGNFFPEIILPARWIWGRLGAICRFIDYRGRTPVKTTTGIRLITAKNVRMGYLRDEPREYIADEDYDGWMTRGIPEHGDLLFTTEAPLGNVAQLLTTERVALAQRIITLHPTTSLHSAYLKVALISPLLQQTIRKSATGTTAQGIKAAKLKLIHLPLPPLAEQARIVAKVDQLMALCDTLEAALRRAESTAQKLAEAVVAELVA